MKCLESSWKVKRKCKNLIQKLEEEEKLKFLKSNIDKVLGTVEIDEATEEELYLQEA